MADMYLQDDELIVTKALPNAASGSIVTDAIDTKGGLDPQGQFYTECEFKINVPELSSTILPAAVVSPAAAAGKLTITVQDADTNDTTGWNAAGTVYSYSIEGGDSGGAPANEKRIRLPFKVKKFIRVKAELNSTATDASAVSITAGFVF